MDWPDDDQAIMTESRSCTCTCFTISRMLLFRNVIKSLSILTACLFYSLNLAGSLNEGRGVVLHSSNHLVLQSTCYNNTESHRIVLHSIRFHSTEPALNCTVWIDSCFKCIFYTLHYPSCIPIRSSWKERDTPWQTSGTGCLWNTMHILKRQLVLMFYINQKTSMIILMGGKNSHVILHFVQCISDATIRKQMVCIREWCKRVQCCMVCSSALIYSRWMQLDNISVLYLSIKQNNAKSFFQIRSQTSSPATHANICLWFKCIWFIWLCISPLSFYYLQHAGYVFGVVCSSVCVCLPSSKIA